MNLLFKISLALCFLVLQVGSQDLPQDFLNAHNAARKEVGVPPMTWDGLLEAYALNYSKQRIDDCSLLHSGGPWGENLAWSSSDLSGTEAVELWIDEKKNYNLESGVCAKDKVCGHYTQVIWINSTRLGCAKVRCNNGGTFFACEYSPPGNIFGKRPTDGIEPLVKAVAPSPHSNRMEIVCIILVTHFVLHTLQQIMCLIHLT